MPCMPANVSNSYFFFAWARGTTAAAGGLPTAAAAEARLCGVPARDARLGAPPPGPGRFGLRAFSRARTAACMVRAAARRAAASFCARCRRACACSAVAAACKWDRARQA